MLATRDSLRPVLLAALALVLLSAAPLFAAGPAAKSPSQAPAPGGGCAPVAGPFADLVAAGFPAPGKALAGPVCPVAASTTRSCTPGVNCHGYCACECSRIKDCNVNSDCGNHRCLGGITCC
jgi:hypothetical protein